MTQMDLLKNFASSSSGQQQQSGEGNKDEGGFGDLLNTVTGMSKKVLPGTGAEGEAKGACGLRVFGDRS